MGVNSEGFTIARFPAANEDVAAVYRELLKTLSPKNIAVFGSSAGDPNWHQPTQVPSSS